MNEKTDLIGDYIALLRDQLALLESTQRPHLERAGALVAATLERGGLVHVFGSGHSHMIAEELFYRAGGLGAVNPVLVDDLMLHVSATGSTVLERMPGRGSELFDTLNAGPADCLIVISNSGGNQIAVELAQRARAAGIAVIAIVSVRHATSAAALRSGAASIDRIADVTIDNLGVVGDAAVDVPGVPSPMGPTSSAIGVTIANIIAMTGAAAAAASGAEPGVFASSNVAGGDDRNRELIGRYQPRVRSL